MKKYQVLIISDAEQDIYEIYQYIAETDAVEKAEVLIEKIEALCASLEHFPERGHIPFELERLQVSDYREIHYKPCRVLYQIIDNHVYVHRVLDGRRNIEQLLLKRLLMFETI